MSWDDCRQHTEHLQNGHFLGPEEAEEDCQIARGYKEMVGELDLVLAWSSLH